MATSNMSELLAKLRAKTANPAGDTPKVDEAKAHAVAIANEVAEQVVAARPVLAARTMESKLGFEFLDKINELELALLERHPRMPLLLREVYSALRKQPENVVLANEEELAIIVQGLDHQTGNELAALAVSQVKKPSARKTAAKISADQLGL